jgi:hypothetical protein
LKEDRVLSICDCDREHFRRWLDQKFEIRLQQSEERRDAGSIARKRRLGG